MVRVVLDTNIYVSAFIFPSGKPEEIVKLAINREFDVFISPDIVEEFAKVLKIKFQYSEQMIKRFIALIKSFAIVINPQKRVNVIKNHRADNKILECVLTAEADYLITGDRRHLLPLGEFNKTKIVSADEFLKLI